MSRHVADAAGARLLSSWWFVSGRVSKRLPPFPPAVSAAIKRTAEGSWWRWCVLIRPLEEATLLVPWFPAGVEHAALVGTVFLHRSCRCRLVAVAHGLTRVSSAGVPESHRLPCRSLWRLQWSPSTLRRPLLIRLVCPQEEVAAARVALVELSALVGTIFAHSQENSILATVAHDDITTVTAAANRGGVDLWSP